MSEIYFNPYVPKDIDKKQEKESRYKRGSKENPCSSFKETYKLLKLKESKHNSIGEDDVQSM